MRLLARIWQLLPCFVYKIIMIEMIKPLKGTIDRDGNHTLRLSAPELQRVKKQKTTGNLKPRKLAAMTSQ